MKQPIDRVLQQLGMPTLVDALADLAGADLTSLLLDVSRRRAARVLPHELLHRYSTDRFVAAPVTPFAALRRVEDALIAGCADAFEVITLAPLVPLGTHSAIATVDQNKVVATSRHSEVAADPTNALALEAATRRNKALRRDAKSQTLIRLGASQRVVRAQQMSGAGRFAHFHLFGLVSAGRDAGGRTFEAAAAVDHLAVHARCLAGLGADSITLSLTDLSGGNAAGIKDAVRAATASFEVVTCVDDDARESGRGYYQTFCFKVHASFGGAAFETSDGGIVNWTQRLVGSAKERCFISGLGIDRVALAIGPP
jgi:hypothetical protein